eukprot:TRINITY_DN153_c2_g1_i1.p1 TRINITY_DN153_c2_g1~~TRINITY_DN153_c2_g1_i1.p1  ORF type:complete len:198 (-),score=82.14 TRINITY_DN153_c2_g1_i1:122-715(-)
MSETHVQTVFDCRQEHALLRKAAESEAKFRQLIEAKHQVLAEKQVQLQAKVAAAEEELRREKEAALELQAEVSLERWEEQQKARNLSTIWPEVEEAAAAVKAADEKVAQLREEAQQQSIEERHQLEVASSLYQMYAASTGIRWDVESEGVEGYIAIEQTARPFKVRDDGTPESADALWAEIEACLPKDVRPGSRGGA